MCAAVLLQQPPGAGGIRQKNKPLLPKSMAAGAPGSGKTGEASLERQFQKSRLTFETDQNSPQESQVVRSTAEILVSQCKSNRLLHWL